MSAQAADQTVADSSLGAEISAHIEMLLEEHGSHEAALWALTHDFLVLMSDADSACSRGFLRGLFSEGARPVRDDDA